MGEKRSLGEVLSELSGLSERHTKGKKEKKIKKRGRER